MGRNTLLWAAQLNSSVGAGFKKLAEFIKIHRILMVKNQHYLRKIQDRIKIS
jgi:hypothetical protein